MNGSKLGFFAKVYYSIAGFSKYRYFLRQSTGKAVIYLLLISMVLALITIIPDSLLYNKAMDELATNFNSLIPDFRLADGKLEVSGEMPIIIDGDGANIIIDTSPGAEERILNQYDIVILITSDKIIQKNFVNKTVRNLSSFQGLVLTRDSIKQVLPIMKPIGVIIFIMAGIFFVCGKFISALIVSLIGLIINSIKNTRLSYRSIFKLSVYSLTMPLLLCTILSLLPVRIPFLALLFYVAAVVYMLGAINSIKKELDNAGDY